MLTLFHGNDQKPGNSFCGPYSLVKLGNNAQTHENFITNGRSTLGPGDDDKTEPQKN